eukprot:scaffold104197_cov36-Phaeocystis_antarctica.AAC.1
MVRGNRPLGDSPRGSSSFGSGSFGSSGLGGCQPGGNLLDRSEQGLVSEAEPAAEDAHPPTIGAAAASARVCNGPAPADGAAARERVRGIGGGHDAHVCADQLEGARVLIDEILRRDLDLRPAAAARLGSSDRNTRLDGSRRLRGGAVSSGECLAPLASLAGRLGQADG